MWIALVVIISTSVNGPLVSGPVDLTMKTDPVGPPVFSMEMHPPDSRVDRMTGIETTVQTYMPTTTTLIFDTEDYCERAKKKLLLASSIKDVICVETQGMQK